ncbi:MAG: MlaD family protein [Pseudomonadota bacterium]
MEPEARYAWVGAGVLALVALLVLGMLWLTGETDDRVIKRYTVYFEQQSLEGLQIGSGVRMQGITVGKVEDYAIIPGHARRVKVTLQVDARTPVLEGAVAEVARHLVTGLSAIDLVNKGEGGPPLMNVPTGEEYPVIPEGVTQFARMASTLEDMGLAGRDALVRFNTLLSDRNMAALGRLVDNLEGISGNLRQTLPALTEETRATLADTRAAAARLDGLGAEASQTLRDSRAHMDGLAAETRATLASARESFQAVNREMAGLSMELKLSADLATQEIQSTAQSLRQAGDALQETGRALSEPARILYGTHEADLGPGEQP